MKRNFKNKGRAKQRHLSTENTRPVSSSHANVVVICPAALVDRHVAHNVKFKDRTIHMANLVLFFIADAYTFLVESYAQKS